MTALKTREKRNYATDASFALSSNSCPITVPLTFGESESTKLDIIMDPQASIVGPNFRKFHYAYGGTGVRTLVEFKANPHAEKNSVAAAFSSASTVFQGATPISLLGFLAAILGTGESQETFYTAEPKWLEEVNRLIDSFGEFAANWNGRGGKPADCDSRTWAKRIAELAAELSASKPFVYPSPEGGIVLEFSNDAKRLTVLVEAEMALSVMSISGNHLRTDANLKGNGLNLFMQQLKLSFETLSE